MRNGKSERVKGGGGVLKHSPDAYKPPPHPQL